MRLAEVVEIVEIDQPEVSANGVLARVHAAALNRIDSYQAQEVVEIANRHHQVVSPI
jgi:NADPH:quinone reductase-like Zn-dependent oxidoreductase